MTQNIQGMNWQQNTEPKYLMTYIYRRILAK
uniref:Uncharacterized protein n=1 Tax=Arundo donax TaxID=35708 RepID=A0A0A9ETS9_ARUDO